MATLNTTSTDFRSYLRQAFKARRAANPKVSAAQFARFLGLSPSFYTRLLAGERRLGEDNAVEIAERLALRGDDRSRFVLSARREHATTVVAKKFFDAELARLQPSVPAFASLKLKDFNLMSEWYCAAILELLTLSENLPKDARAIGFRLGIHEVEASLALDRLAQSDLIEHGPDGVWRVKKSHVSTGHPSSATLRRFHRQHLQRAAEAIETQAQELREFDGVTMAIDVERLPEAKDMLRRAVFDICKALNTGHTTAVYHLSTQLFRLDRAPRKVPARTADLKGV